MREPTHDEMVEGIEKAVYKMLDLQRYGYVDRRPEYAWPTAFRNAVASFLEKHKKEILANLPQQREEKNYSSPFFPERDEQVEDFFVRNYEHLAPQLFGIYSCHRGMSQSVLDALESTLVFHLSLFQNEDC